MLLVVLLVIRSNECGDAPNVAMHQMWRCPKCGDAPNVVMVFMFLKFSHGFLRFFMVLCFVSIMFCGPCWSGGPWVGLARGSDGPMGLVDFVGC